MLRENFRDAVNEFRSIVFENFKTARLFNKIKTEYIFKILSSCGMKETSTRSFLFQNQLECMNFTI